MEGAVSPRLALTLIVDARVVGEARSEPVRHHGPSNGEGVMSLHDEIRKLLSPSDRNELILLIIASVIVLLWLFIASYQGRMAL